MSIGIYAFLRIYFLSFGLSAFAQFRTHSMPSSVQTPVRSSPRVLSGIECRPVQRVQRPGVCLALRGLPCIWHGLPCCLSCAVVPGALGAGVSTGGAYSHSPAPPGQSRHHRKNKKGSKNHPTTIVNLKNFPQKQKDPYKGSVFCAILALQALKGRNLQWLKVK